MKVHTHTFRLEDYRAMLGAGYAYPVNASDVERERCHVARALELARARYALDYDSDVYVAWEHDPTAPEGNVHTCYLMADLEPDCRTLQALGGVELGEWPGACEYMRMVEAELYALVLEDARRWALDCQWLDDAEELDERLRRDPILLRRGIERHYEDGWTGFLSEV